MSIINEFISEYGMTLLYTAVMAVFGFIGMAVKRIVQKYLNDKTKQEIVKAAVQAVEQIAHDIHGEEKLERAKAYIVDALQEKGIGISQLELELLIEAAVGEFNKAFKPNTDTVLG